MNYALLLLSTLLMLLFSCSDQSLQSTSEGSPFQWKGARTTDPTPAQLNWAYYNTTSKTSFIFNGRTWDTMVVSGIDGKNVRWLGERDTFPYGDELRSNSAFFYSVDSSSYIFDGKKWSLMTPAGLDGKDVVWKGDLGKAPANPELNWAYHDSVQKKSFVYTGTKWELFSADGLNGQKLIWRGFSDKHLSFPQKNWAYYNTAERTSYLYDGTMWKIITKDGLDAPQGDPMVWLGEFPAPPENPKLNWMYRNSTDGCSYLWDGITWNLVARVGKNGVPIIWKGEWPESPLEPRINWAYFNLVDNSSYIFNGREWELLSKSGVNGLDGVALNWRGHWNTAPEKPSVNWVYYNENKGITYIFDGTNWQVFCKDGSTITRYQRAKVAFGDTLILNHGFNSYDFTSTTHYYNQGDETIYSWDMVDENWKQNFEVVFDKLLYTSQTVAPYQQLFKYKNGTLIHLYTEQTGIIRGTRFFSVDYSGVAGGVKTLTDDSCAIQNFFVLGDDSYGFAYLSYPEVGRSEARIALYKPNGVRKDILVGENFSAFRANAYQDTALLCAWIKGNEARWSRISTSGSPVITGQISAEIDTLYEQKDMHIRTYPNGRTFFVVERGGETSTLAGFIGVSGSLQDTVPNFFKVSKCEPIVFDEYRGISDTWVSEGRRPIRRYYELSMGHSVGTQRTYRMASLKNFSDITYSSDFKKNTLAIQSAENESILSDVPATLFYVDQDLRELTTQTLSTRYMTPRVVAIDTATFAFTYVDRLIKKDVRCTVLRRSTDTPRIVVKRLDMNRIAVINRTGIEQDIMVSATKGYR